MRTPDFNSVARVERGAGVDSIGNHRYRDSRPGPSYVQAVLFGKGRTRGTRPLPVPAPHGAAQTRANAPLPGNEGSTARSAPEQERN